MLIRLVLLLVIICAIFYTFALVNPDVGDHFQYILRMNEDYMNEGLTALRNANALVNLPTVRFDVEANPQLASQGRCRESAQWLGSTDGPHLRKLCLDTCGSGAKVMHVSDENSEIFFKNVKLRSGFWCLLDVPKCNLRTGYVVASSNGIACKTKYPNMFGGPEASTIVACNDELLPSTGSTLWDFDSNEPVNPETIEMTSEDERLSDGSFRFGCKFGLDRFRNQFIANPLNRFHPIQNPCLFGSYAVGGNAKLIVSSDGQNWRCDCGEFNQTRIQNTVPHDDKSPCSSCVTRLNATAGGASTIGIGCYHVESTYSDALRYNPCPGAKFQRFGSNCEVLKLDVKEHEITDPFMTPPLFGPQTYMEEIKLADEDSFFII